ncbi:MAG: hypothetical protein KBD01_19210 [Acidobacteria bacterium]|nr:hypothetical protein [Acidobacteriota bacterium]
MCLETVAGERLRTSTIWHRPSSSTLTAASARAAVAGRIPTVAEIQSLLT